MLLVPASLPRHVLPLAKAAAPTGEWKYIMHKAQAEKGHIVPSAHIPVAEASHMPAELNSHATGGTCSRVGRPAESRGRGH